MLLSACIKSFVLGHFFMLMSARQVYNDKRPPGTAVVERRGNHLGEGQGRACSWKC